MDMENSKWKFNIICNEYSRKFQIATVRLHLYSIVILLTLIIYHPLNILLSILSQWESLINLAMCKTQILGICLQRTVRQRTKGKKRHNIIVCPPPSHPAERMGHFYSIHTAGVAKLHFRLRLQLSDFLRATTMSLPPFYSPILFKRMDRR